MDWWEDKYTRQLYFREFLKLWYLWLFDIILLILIICSIIAIPLCRENIIDKIFQLLVLPLLVSILVSCIFAQYKTLQENCNWAELEVHVYRDLLTNFSRIIATLSQSIGIKTPPLLVTYFKEQEINQLIDVFLDKLNQNQNLGFETDVYQNSIVPKTIQTMSSLYYPMLKSSCTDTVFVLFFSVLTTNLIKLDEDIANFGNPDFWKEARPNAILQMINIADHIKFLYQRIYNIVTNSKKHEGGIHMYEDKMFGGIGIEPNPVLRKEALKKAWETRNFEIELYWKRTAYFWAFIITIAIAYYKILISDGFIASNIVFLTISYLLGGLLVAFSLAWFLANIASKHWQENWENHIKLLEDQEEGRLYKTIVSDYKKPAKPSVSRLNLKLSFLIALISIAIFIFTSTNIIISLSVTVVVVLIMICGEKIPFKTLFCLLFRNKKYNNLYFKNGKVSDINIEEMEK